jgi:O-antigen/teichoic acid export membrane protein
LIERLLKNRARSYLLFSQIVIAIVGLLTGKIIAIYFSPEDFGLFNLQFALYTFFFSLLLSPFIQFTKTVTKTLLPKLGYSYFLYLVSILMLVFYLVVLGVFCNSYSIYNYFFLILVFLIPANVLFNLLSDYLNIQNSLNLFSFSNLLKNLGSLCFVGLLFFINYKYSDGATILWINQIVGFLFGTLLFLPYYKIRFPSSNKISFYNFIKKYNKYAWPLMVLAFWSWINNYFDRFAIEYYLDIKSVGIYNANYAVGSKFFLLLNPFFLTLLTPNIYNTSSVSSRKETVTKYSKLYVLISIPILITIYFLGDYIGLFLLSKSYEAGFYLIFWISLAYFFLTIVYLYETIFYAESKTKVILFSNIVSAILNVVLNILLIPIYGLNGAFIATLISFLFRLLVVKFYFNRL